MKDFFKKNTDNEPINNDGFSVDISLADDFSEPLPVEQAKTVTQNILEWFEIFVTAIIAVVVIFTLFFRIATIDGSSMLNTLRHGEKIIISDFNYTPKQGDIVVISRNIENSAETQTSSNTPIIKRVIAVGGQTVDIDFESSTVYVDGKPLDEPYTSTPTDHTLGVEFPKYVPEGYVFVLGDNRNNSLDSRSPSIGEDGLIDERYILGKAIYRILPFNTAGRLDNK